jgi:hypothetical protein
MSMRGSAPDCNEARLHQEEQEPCGRDDAVCPNQRVEAAFVWRSTSEGPKPATLTKMTNYAAPMYSPVGGPHVCSSCPASFPNGA